MSKITIENMEFYAYLLFLFEVTMIGVEFHVFYCDF